MAAQTKTYVLTYEFLNTFCTFETTDIKTLLKKLDTFKESYEINKQSITINTIEKWKHKKTFRALQAWTTH